MKSRTITAATKSHLIIFAAFISFLILSSACSRRTAAPEVTFPLKEYVMAGDDAFSYKITDSVTGENWKAYHVKMISGKWLTENDVDSVTWWHWINIIIPDHVRESESMMFIGGGSSRDTIAPLPDEWLIKGAVATGSIISYLSNIPFQPVDFKDDDKGGRYEDDLIAYGWRKYLESGASEDKMEWLARFPMTRAVVRAMDVVQEISGQIGAPVDSFLVTGASKRGWTTWTTAAVDDRIMAIAPIVIDLLNLIPSFKHHWQCYGEWSPAVEEYVREGIMDRIDEPEFRKLLEKVEPYSFTGELTIPKYIVNATSDEFFVTDSWKFYWDDLKGESYLHYVPNANHSLRNAYQPISLISFYQRIITGTAIPSFDWTISNDTIYVEVDPESDYMINKWEAVNPKGRDFRKYVVGDAWYKEEINRDENGKYTIYTEKPGSGYKASLVEVIFDPGSVFPLTFSTGTVVAPDTYPFPPFQAPMLKRVRER